MFTFYNIFCSFRWKIFREFWILCDGRKETVTDVFHLISNKDLTDGEKSVRHMNRNRELVNGLLILTKLGKFFSNQWKPSKTKALAAWIGKLHGKHHSNVWHDVSRCYDQRSVPPIIHRSWHAARLIRLTCLLFTSRSRSHTPPHTHLSQPILTT